MVQLPNDAPDVHHPGQGCCRWIFSIDVYMQSPIKSKLNAVNALQKLVFE
jgi:hypothetical protein